MTDIKQLAEVCDLVQTESESQTATLAERVLTPEAQAERDDFQAEYGYDGNCSCHISPPCNSCLHPGNPRNQEEDETAWVADGAIDWTAPEMQYLAPKDYDLPPADPALLASANRILSDRLEGVAHVLRGCGLPALRDQKPVAVYKGHRHIPSDTKEFWGMADNHLPAGTHLYAPPVLSRELTDKVIERLFDESAFQENEMRDAADYFAHEIERYLKGEGE